MPEDNLNEMVRAKMLGTGQEKKEEEKDVTLGSIKRMLAEQLEIKTLKSLVTDPPPAPVMSPAINIPQQEAPFKMTGTFNMSDIVNSQTAARENAERARDDAQRAYWESMSKRYEDLLKYAMERSKDKPEERQESPYAVYQNIKVMMDDIKKELQPAAGMAGGLPLSGGMDHTVMIELKRMDFDQQARMFELQESSKQRDKDFQLQMLKLGKQDAAMSRLSDLGSSLADGIAEAMGDKGIDSSISNVPAKLASFKCQMEGCGQVVPIITGQAKQICPKCSAEYEIT